MNKTSHRPAAYAACALALLVCLAPPLRAVPTAAGGYSGKGRPTAALPHSGARGSRSEDLDLDASERTIIASWYGRENQGGPTASGERFNMYHYTAAHRSLPFGTILSVRNPTNDESVRVTVTDRGPFVRGRDLDLSYAAARDLGILNSGVSRLVVAEVGFDDHFAKEKRE